MQELGSSTGSTTLGCSTSTKAPAANSTEASSTVGTTGDNSQASSSRKLEARSQPASR